MGRLPNIENLINKGTYVKKGIGSFPSMTGYAFYPFITGKKAIESNVLGLRWFDRSLDYGNLRNYVGRTNVWMNRDINRDIKTIFEYFPENYTVSINSFMNRGVQHESVTGWPLTTAKFNSLPLFKMIKRIPLLGSKNSYTHFEHESLIMQEGIDQLKNNPKVQWITFPGLDAMHHINGMTDDYPILLSHIDELIGAFVDSVSANGQSNSRMIALISDHGISDVDVNHNVPFYLDSLTNIRLRRGASTSIRKQTLDDPLSDMEDVDGYYVVNGDLIGFIYMKDPNISGNESWRERIAIEQLRKYPNAKGEYHDLISGLEQLEGVSFIAYLDNDKVWITNEFGKGVITKEQNRLHYIVEGDDPLQYPRNLHDVSLDEEQWLDKTIDLNYPMGVSKLYDLIIHPNMGDILLCTLPGYDLAADYEILVGNYKGGHGDLRSELTVVPYVIYQPGQVAEELPYATSVDIGKLVFNWLGIKQ